MAPPSHHNTVPAGRIVTLDREGIDRLFFYLRQRVTLDRLIEEEHQEAQRAQDLLKERLEAEKARENDAQSQEIPWVSLDRDQLRYESQPNTTKERKDSAVGREAASKVVAVVEKPILFWKMEQAAHFSNDPTARWAIDQLFFRHPLMYYTFADSMRELEVEEDGRWVLMRSEPWEWAK